MYLDSFDAFSNEKEVFGAHIAISDFHAALLRHGPPAHYSFFQYHNPLTGDADRWEQLGSIAGHRADCRLDFFDIAHLKAGRIPFDFSNWHDVDGYFSELATLRANLSPRLYPISSTFHILSYPHLLQSWILRLLLVKSYACDSVICTSHAARQALQNLLDHVASRLRSSHGLEAAFEGRMDVIPYALDTDRFRPRNKQAVREQLDLPLDAFLILWIGRLSMIDKADLLPLIQVFQELVIRNPDKKLILLIGGAGPALFTDMAIDLARDLGIVDRVLFVSPLPPTVRELYFSAADVFVSPADNIQETFGITPQEAMASGVPQVVSDWNGYRDTVAEGETGFLVPTYVARTDTRTCLQSGLFDRYDMMDHFRMGQGTVIDLRRYREALQILIDNEELHSHMRRRSRKRALDLFSGEVVISRHADLWKEQRQIAADTVYRPTPGLDYAVPAYFDAFRHYATRTLSGITKVTASARGASVLAGATRLPLPTRTMEIFDERLLVDLLALVEATQAASSFQDIEDRRADTDAEEVRRHLMWLLKYGLVEMVP